MIAVTRFVLRHRRLVVAAWLLLALAGAATAGTTTNRLSQQFSLPQSEGYKANTALESAFGNGGDEVSLVPVVKLPEGTTVDSPGVRHQLAAAFSAMQSADPGARITSYASTGDRTFVSKDGRVTYGLVFTRFHGATAPPENDAIKHAVASVTVSGAPVRFTGLEDLQTGGGGDNAGPGVLLETLIGGIGALLVLAFVFASLMARAAGPALVSLFGRWNWVLPSRAARVLMVRPSGAPERAPAPADG